MMLTVFGSINVDQVVRVAHIARPGETVPGRLEAVTFGGKGANQAVAAARLLDGTHPVAMAGALGDDAQAGDVLANFDANGVAKDLVARVPGPSGTAIISLDDAGENAITLIGGANDAVVGTQLDTSDLAATDTLLCQGEIAFSETAAAIARYAEARPHGRVVLNLAPVPETDAATMRQILDGTHMLIVNEHEARLLAQTLGTSADPEAIAIDHGLTLVVTRGAKGALAIEADGTRHEAASPAIAVVDTTGAGDTFVGVLAALLTEGEALHTAMQKACVAGAISCTRLGAQGGMPTRAELDAGALS